jgi:DNA-binding response OmpR family regulator
VLEPRGYDVVTAADGPAALALVQSADLDLVLLDVVMPEMDGYAVCRRIREREETAVLPVIMVTSSGGQEKRQRQAGADDFVQKPFDQHELLTRVRSLLRIKRYHDTIKTQSPAAARAQPDSRTTRSDPARRARAVAALRRFLSPQLSEAIVSSGDESILASHRREVAMFFADLRGWTSFVDSAEPEN